MKTRGYAILMVLAIAAGAAGCARHASVAPTARPVRKTAPTQMQWGPAAEGLQCRLRPVKRTFPAGESPAFKIDLRNRGSRVFAYLQNERIPLDRFAIDGSWRPWPDRRPTRGKVLALAPGVELTDLLVTIPPHGPSHLPPGLHVVQVAFCFEGLEVVSNPVEIEILGSR
ncbi:MAG TPA: hypothetical protein PK373_03450 [Sedimentisphaerales bacterium]|nr:hypothetical protein [Sedimentisphaerales bacterium]HQG48121.1 hypothetical protein [Sedimentisphaerales bacterium]HQI27333.1 hypothetical protein [Sedimentisphaerales bacterium]